MTKEQLKELATDATNEKELTCKDIPAIDLYVDQIINLISSRLAEGSVRHQSKQLTKTMINNYSKDGVIAPVKGKKYSREQVIQILYVYSLKSTLSIGEIKRLLGGAYETDCFGADDLAALYDKHELIKDKTRELALDLLDKDILDSLSLDVSEKTDYISVICALVSMSAHLKNIAQAMIDEKFPVPVVEEDDDKKDKKEEKLKDKEEKLKDKEEKLKEKEKTKQKKET